MTDRDSPRRSFWLYLPILLFALVAGAWSGFWVYARHQAETRMSALLAREAGNGRQWTCADMAFGGYPFRLELRCSDVILLRRSGEAAPTRFQLGGFAAVTQIYAPGHVIAESPGPLIITSPAASVTRLDWTSGQMSLRVSLTGVERASLVLDQPKLSLAGLARGNGEGSAKAMELHLRRHPTRPPEDRAIETSLTLSEATGPWLEAVIGNGAPAELAFGASLPQAQLFATGVRVDTLKAWATSGAMLAIDRLTLKKGSSELSLTGTLGLDDLNRLKGRITAAQNGITEIGGIRVGGLLGLGGLLAPPGRAPAGLKPLPPVEMRDGRLYLGPVRVPEFRLDPLL